MNVKPILGAAVGLQSVALVGRAYQMIPKELMYQPRYTNQLRYAGKPVKAKMSAYKPLYRPRGYPNTPNYKMMNKRLIRGSVDLMVGIPLVGATAGMVNTL